MITPIVKCEVKLLITVEVWEFHPTFCWTCDNLSMLGLMLIDLTKRVSGVMWFTQHNCVQAMVLFVNIRTTSMKGVVTEGGYFKPERTSYHSRTVFSILSPSTRRGLSQWENIIDGRHNHILYYRCRSESNSMLCYATLSRESLV